MDTKTATIMLRGLLDNAGHGNLVSESSPALIEAVKLCLSFSPDVAADMGHGASLLASSVSRPEVAILLIDAGAPIDQRVVSALAKARCSWGNGMPSAYTGLVCKVAELRPDLNWYVFEKNEPGGYYENIPAANLIEKKAEGFNKVLEKAQATCGLPVGRIPLMCKQDRIDALEDFSRWSPDLFYIGERPLKEILLTLLADDIDPNIRFDCGIMGDTISLLEDITRNWEDAVLTKTLLDLGVRVEPSVWMKCAVIMEKNPAFIETIDILHEKHRDILDVQLSEDEVELRDGAQTPRDYIRSVAPKAFAHIQSKELSKITAPGQKNTRGMRL